MSFPDDEEEFDYENDDSWYENAMNELDSPTNNNHIIYSEEDIKDLTDFDKTLIRHRNYLLEKGFEHVELKKGDHIYEIVHYSGVLHVLLCDFIIVYRKNNSYMAIYGVDPHQGETDNENTHPVQIHLAALIHCGQHLGSYQFTEFFVFEEEIAEDQKVLNGITINRELTYRGKPSLQLYKSDKESINQSYIEKMEVIDPRLFEFLNEYLIVELKEGKRIEEYLELISSLET